MGVDQALTNGGIVCYDTEKRTILFNKTYAYTSKLSQQRRLYLISNLVDGAIANYNIDIVILEQQFVDTLSRVTGALEAIVGKNNLPMEKMSPAHWKKQLSGQGKLSKKETETYLRNNYNDVYEQLEDKTEHTFDALGMIFAYLKKYGLE